MKRILFLCFTAMCLNSFAQSDIAIQWQKSYGGTAEDYAYSVQTTTDGGYIMAGYTYSVNGDVTGSHGSQDYWVVKTDVWGVIQWEKCYGGTAGEIARSIQQTSDGGYIIAGKSSSNDGDVTGNHGGYGDYWLVKIDSNGMIQWQKCYGGSAEDFAICVQQTSDKGYIVAGRSDSNDGDVTGSHGMHDSWVVKTDQTGGILWQRCYGGSDDDQAQDIKQTSDGGYIIAGKSLSIDGDVTSNHDGGDYWIVKTDALGVIQWQKCYGGSSTEMAMRINQTSDGGYIIAGSTSSNDGDVTGYQGMWDCWVVKTDQTGVLLWQRCYGGSGIENAQDMNQTSDGGYIITGDSGGTGGIGLSWSVKINNSGEVQWQKNIGGYSIKQTIDGGYITAGDIYVSDHGRDYFLAKLCYPDPLSISISDSTYCLFTTLTATEGFSSYLWSTGDTTKIIEVTNGGTYSVKATNLSGCPSEISIAVPNPCPSILEAVGRNATTCTSDGIIDFTFTNVPDGVYPINYDGGSFTNFVIVNGRATVSAPVGTYNNLTITSNGCTSALGMNVLLTEPAKPTLIAIGTDPQYCYSIGRIDFQFANVPDGNYTIKNDQAWFDFDNVLVSNGKASVSTYGSTYNNLTITVNGCTSDKGVNIHLISPPAPIMNALGIKPTNCSGDGRINFNFKNVPDGVYSIEYWGGKFSNVTVFENKAAVSAPIGIYDYLRILIGDSCYSDFTGLTVTPLKPYTEEQICMVTTDETSGKNVVMINKTLNVGTDTIQIYRMDNLTSKYKIIGTLDINQLSSFIDSDAIPAQQNYQYRISVKDTCGNKSDLSNAHRTILLQASAGVNREVNLYWNPYEGFSYPNFQIYRSNSGGEYFLIGVVPNNTYSFTDLTPPAGTNNYKVRVMRDNACSPLKSSYNYVSSNAAKVGALGIGENPAVSFSVHPNPATNQLMLKATSDLKDFDYKISDLTGRILLIGKIAGEETTLDISELLKGMYILSVGKKNEQFIKFIKQ